MASSRRSAPLDDLPGWLSVSHPNEHSEHAVGVRGCHATHRVVLWHLSPEVPGKRSRWPGRWRGRFFAVALRAGGVPCITLPWTSRLGLAENLLGILHRPGCGSSWRRRIRARLGQFGGILKIPSSHLGLVARDESARDPPPIPRAGSQADGYCHDQGPGQAYCRTALLRVGTQIPFLSG